MAKSLASSRSGRVKKGTGKTQKGKIYTKSQRIKDNESLVSLDRSANEQHRQLREQAENPIPKPDKQHSHPEEWEVLVKMNELAKSSIAAKPSVSTSELRSRKRQEADVLNNLLNGLNSIEVSKDQPEQPHIHLKPPSHQPAGTNTSTHVDIDM